MNKTENRIKFKIKTGYYLRLLTLETMKLLGSNKSMITKNEEGENVNLEITKIIFLILLIIIINKIQESCIHLFLINC